MKVVRFLVVFFLCSKMSGAQAVEAPNSASPQTCAHVQAADFTSFWSTVYGLQYLYKARAFNELDLSLSCLVSSAQSFSTGQNGSSAAYWFYRIQMPSPGVDPNESELVQAWRRSAPASIFSEFAALRLGYANAWRIRGGAFYRDVPTEQARQFAEKMSETAALLELATPTLKNTTLWHNLKLAVVQDDDSADRQRASAAFEVAVTKWPRHFDFYEVAVSRLVPRWGGSWRDVDVFVRKWSTRLETSEGKSMYARLYASVLTTGGPNPSETGIDMERMDASLHDLLRRYPASRFIAFAASFACFKGDKVAFRTAIERLDPTQDGPAYWIKGTAPTSCAQKLS